MVETARRPKDAGPARMGPLAKLPLFMDLAGKRVIVAGGSDGAAWKAELLAAAGGLVDIYSAEPSEEMHELVRRGPVAGSLTLHERPWSIDIFTHAVFALCDTEIEGEAWAFRCAAKAAGVLCNVVDKPAFCDVQFGSIVNRSPVIIGISTDGAAPVLGQAIRRRIETMLPPAMAAWGALAKRIRDRVTQRLAPGGERRRFWELFAEKAFGAAPDSSDDDRLIEAVAGIAGAPDAAGRVTLVGAGPGDTDLLTLKAVRALQSADVILCDDLVSPDVLELGRREARRIMVGKRGGRDSCRQEDINDLMVKLVHEGNHVVRLKAGDPMVFGRAGEELDRLTSEGLSVTVVPGISAAIALASALGVSLTHRDLAHSLRFVTGHGKHGELDETLDWRGLADPETTLVVYMGGRTAAGIAKRLMDEGLPGDTPGVLGYNVGQIGQRFVPFYIEQLKSPKFVDLGHPLVIGIGKVFSILKKT